MSAEQCGQKVQFGGDGHCGCPIQNGMTYHDRETCGDPVVARLNWFADGGQGDLAAAVARSDLALPVDQLAAIFDAVCYAMDRVESWEHFGELKGLVVGLMVKAQHPLPDFAAELKDRADLIRARSVGWYR